MLKLKYSEDVQDGLDFVFSNKDYEFLSHTKSKKLFKKRVRNMQFRILLDKVKLKSFWW